MALLSAKNVRKSYKIGANDKQEVLKGVDIEFKSGDLIALLGESGCGKSTLINILGGLDNDYTGSVVLKNEYIRDYTEAQMDDYRKKRVGLIFQNYELIPNLNLKDNIVISMTMSDIDKQVSSDRAEDLLKLVGLYEFREKMPNQLSGGQKQRIAIARALANNPTIILADEPTGALDAESADLVMDILTRIAKSGKLVIIVTHSEKVALNCPRVLKMEDGKIVSDSQNFKMQIDSSRDKHIEPKKARSGDLFKLARKNIAQTKQRSIMISFGMGIAIAMVLLILCLSDGLTNYVNQLQADQGATIIMAYRSEFGTISTTSMEEYIDDIEGFDGVEEIVTSYTGKSVDYTFETTSSSGVIEYIFEDTDLTYDFTILYGSDMSSDSQIIINEALAQLLAGDNGIITAVGQEIALSDSSITNGTYTIVGVYEDTTAFSSTSNAYVRSGTMDALYSGSSSYKDNTLIIEIADITYISDLEMVITSDYLGLEMTQVENSAEELLGYIESATLVLIGIGAVSLFISAIMIFIVLTVSTSERKREIGLLRAIGGRKADIVKLFVFESICLGLMGGAFAVLSSLVLSSVINLICYATLESIFVSYNIFYYLGCYLLTIAISVLSGIAPAYKASFLDPVECIRGE